MQHAQHPPPLPPLSSPPGALPPSLFLPFPCFPESSGHILPLPSHSYPHAPMPRHLFQELWHRRVVVEFQFVSIFRLLFGCRKWRGRGVWGPSFIRAKDGDKAGSLFSSYFRRMVPAGLSLEVLVPSLALNCGGMVGGRFT